MYTIGTLSFDNPLKQLQQNILHVDMDAYYASLAERDNPDLIGKPVVMARHPHETGGKGIVTTANYIAREYGIHSGMPSWKAYQLCPTAEFVPVNHPYVRSVSQQLYRIFLQYTEDVQRIAYDEAYLSLDMMQDGEQVAKQIKQQIKDELDLTCSIGVSYNKTLAKLASDYQKPNGLTVIEVEKALAFLDQLDVKDVHGIGPKTVGKLDKYQVRTVQDLKKMNEDDLRTVFGSSVESLMYRLNGIDPTPVVTDREPKSSGNERTYHPFLASDVEVQQAIIELVDKVGDTLERERLYGNTVVLKLRDAEFKNFSRRLHLDYAFQDKATIYDLAWKAWLELRPQMNHAIRLVGVTLTGLDSNEGRQQGQMLLL